MQRRNLAGPQVRRLRCQRGWSQEQLAAKLQLEGLDISRSSIAKIENGQQAIFDYELLIFQRLFRVPEDELHPAFDPCAPDFHRKILEFLERE